MQEELLDKIQTALGKRKDGVGEEIYSSMITIVDVARESGVSIGTASRALNGTSYVSAKTKAKVLETAERLHYIPNESARSLKLIDTNAVIVIVQGISNLFYAPILDILLRGLQEKGYSAIVTPADYTNDPVLLAKKMEREKKPNGIVFLGGDLQKMKDELQTLEVPFVLTSIGTEDESIEFGNGVLVGGSDYMNGVMITDYLASLGHRKIALLMAEPDASISVMRRRGYQDTLKKYGIEYDEKLVFSAGNENSNFSIESGYAAMSHILEKKPEFTALECLSDTLAFGAERALYEHGYDVPGDISLTGMDGTPLAKYAVPSITTVEVDAMSFATISKEAILHLMQGKTEKKFHRIDVRMVAGGSTGPAPKRDKANLLQKR